MAEVGARRVGVRMDATTWEGGRSVIDDKELRDIRYDEFINWCMRTLVDALIRGGMNNMRAEISTIMTAHAAWQKARASQGDTR